MAKTASSRAGVSDRVEAKIQNASDLPQRLRFLIYGRGGAGKTRLASTAPNVLVVDVNEEGTDSVRRDIDPKVFPVNLWTDLQDIYWYLQSGEHDFDSVAVDGLTEMQTLCMKFVLGDEASRDASRDPNMPSKQVWGKVGELMKTQITNFRNLPMNVIFTARQRVRATTGEEGDVEELLITPALSPSILQHAEGAVALIGHLAKQEVIVKKKSKKDPTKVVRAKSIRTRLFVAPSEKYTTKERYGVFGDYIDNPNCAKMFETIYHQEEA